MTEQDQQKALAELDGCSCGVIVVPHSCVYARKEENKSYLTSYDAIIPLIQKQPKLVIEKLIICLWEIIGIDSDDDEQGAWTKLLETVTPSQLSEALLRATNLWKE